MDPEAWTVLVAEWAPWWPDDFWWAAAFPRSACVVDAAALVGPPAPNKATLTNPATSSPITLRASATTRRALPCSRWEAMPGGIDRHSAHL